MNVIIVGCGRLGADLAYRLFKQGYEVSVIDSVAAAFNNLPSDFEGRINEGDALSQDVLHRAGIEKADAVAAVTNSDSLNAVIGQIARVAYRIPNVVVRNYDPLARPVLEAFGLQLVSSTAWGAQRVEELISYQEVRTVFSSGNGEVDIYEFYIPQAWHGRTVKDLLVPGVTRAASLARAGKAVLPDDDTVLQASDELLISATIEGAEQLRQRLGLKKQEG